MYCIVMTWHFVNVANMHFSINRDFFDYFQIDPATYKIILGIVNENHHWMLVVRTSSVSTVYTLHIISHLLDKFGHAYVLSIIRKKVYTIPYIVEFQ